MIYPPIAELINKTKTRYSLAILTARRARQLGAQIEGEYAGNFDEAILKAIEEINEGKVSSRPKNYYFNSYINATEKEDCAVDQMVEDSMADSEDSDE